MNDDVILLYPEAGEKRPLRNLYLNQDIRQEKQPFVYANFVVSVDGRIAIPHPSGQGLMVPKAIANERDWRLFQELAAQADLIISSGRYLRDWADGRAQEILQTADPRFADLRRWREEQGLKPQPDIAIISGSLDFPIPEVLTGNGRNAIIFTTANRDPARVAEIEAQAGQVFVVGEESVDGQRLVQTMHDLGYQTVYSAAGPRILHMLLTAGVLDRLYLTQASRILGGDPFATIVDGGVLDTAVDLNLHSIALDPAGLDGQGQLLLSYNRA
jgi:riboflavin biosynthesis pyrimidine reductase